VRHVPLEAVLATDAELDHTVGILLLREARSLQLYMTPAVRSILEQDSRIVSVTRAFTQVVVTELTPGLRTPLRYRHGETSGLSAEPFAVPAGPPRFASAAGPGHTVGLVIRDEATGGSCAFVPGCGDLSPATLDRLEKNDLVLFDGTFWSDDELVRLDISDRHAREMDHLPVSGPEGSLARLAALTGPRVVYTHMNNTNPMLLEDSAERATVDRAGVTIGVDGMSFTI
jgi:pyrroloquinoline quinone biosynthesis protein B